MLVCTMYISQIYRKKEKKIVTKIIFKSSNKHVVLQNLSIYYLCKNIRQHCKNNKLKITALMWNAEFELPDGSYSVSDIQEYIEYIRKTI